MKSNKIYWHRLDDFDYQRLMKKEPTVEDILNNYAQPPWCGLIEALHPTKGCEFLTGEDRMDISEFFCKDCKFCKPKKMGMFGV
jgi:hypothetical protein